jgi:branched-chain amino acid transport system permease protein
MSTSNDDAVPARSATRRVRWRISGAGRLAIGALLVALTASVPLWPGVNDYIIALIVRALIFIALGQAWNVVAGIGGQLSLGNGVFFGIGAYGTAMLFTRLGITPWAGLLVTAALATIVAVVMGAATLRFRGVYFALATVVISLGFERLTRHFVDFTGGDAGFSEPFLGTSLWAMQSRGPVPFLMLSLAVVVGFYLLTRWLLVSSFGLQLQSVRDEEAAAASGVNVFRIKILGLMLSAAMTALVGALYIQFYLTIDPTAAFGMMQEIQIQLPALIGGLGTGGGPVIGGAFMIFVSELTNWLASGFSLHGLDVLAYGLLLLAVVLRAPLGVIGAFTRSPGGMRRR